MQSKSFSEARSIGTVPGVVLAAFVVVSGCQGESKQRSPGSPSGGSAGVAPGTGGASATGGNGGSSGTAGNTATGGATAAGASGSESGGTTSSSGGSGNTAAGGSTTTGGSENGGSAGSSASAGTTATGGATATGGSGPAGGEGGADVEPPGDTPPSCAGFTGTECQGDDCCESPIVPGGTVTVDETEHMLRSFRLDKYEVTVARFRNYMNAVDAWQAGGNPTAGTGAHPDVPTSGWRTSWPEVLDAFISVGIIPSWRGYPTTWGGEPSGPIIYGGNPNYVITGTDLLAVNHVPWHITFAFCIWDGGRLPTKQEWLYAAKRGDEQTRYPWGDAPTVAEMFVDRPAVSVPTPYASDAFWKYIGIPVGSHPASAGRFGHQDLAAGLGEYVRDTVPPVADDRLGGLIELGNDVELDGFHRGVAVASWEGLGAIQVGGSSGVGSGTYGFRCARDL